MEPLPTLGTLMSSYFRVKVITITTSFMTNLDLMLLLVMLVSSNLNCQNYETWFQEICAPIYLAYQVIVPLLLGFVTDLTQNYSLPIMRLCSILIILFDAMIYFLPFYFPNIYLFQIPTYVLVCFLARQGAIFQVSNCLGKILKMKLDMDLTPEENQIAIFNHVGIFCDGVSRVFLIITFLVIWICISVLQLNIGFEWMKGILFISSFFMDILTVAFCFAIPEGTSLLLNLLFFNLIEYFLASSNFQVTALKGDIQSDVEDFRATTSSIANDPLITSTHKEAIRPTSLFSYFKEAAIVIWKHEGGLLRDINLHLIFSIAAFSFVTLILQFEVQIPNHGTDFRNGFCGGQLMGMILLNIMKNSVMIIGAILYQTVFVNMRPFYFFRFIYVFICVIVILSLVFKYAFFLF